MNKFIRVLTLCPLFVVACHEDNPIESRPPFQIAIQDQDDHNVAGVTLEGGVDWDSYSVQTNGVGVATLPGSARGNSVVAFKTGYVPFRIDRVFPGDYTIRYNPKRLHFIGETKGRAIVFGSSDIITIDGSGEYRVYSYTDQSVSLTAEVRLIDSTNTVREFQLHGDTLWFTTHDSGIYVFSLQFRTNPQLLFRLGVPGYLGAFALKDSLVIVGSPFEPGPLRFFVYQADGTFHQTSYLNNYWVRQMRLFDNFLLLFGGRESLPTVLDISNPFSPVIVYNGLEWDYQRAVVHGRQVILVPWAHQDYYKAMDFSNPRNPRLITAFDAAAWLVGFANDSIAYGYDYVHSRTYTLNEGEYHSEYFQTVATISEGTYNGVGGAFHPFYIIGDRLWKLVDR